MGTFVQLLSLENAPVVPAPWFDPPHVRVHTRDASVVDLLEEVIQESTELHGIVLFKPVPSGSVKPHVFQHWPDESVRFF